MKKIGIVTFYDGINAGGFLQAYALMNYLKIKNPSLEISFIKNPSSNLFYKDLLKGVLRKNVMLSFNHIKKSINFKREINQLNVNNYKEEYDLIIFGSDIIWNYDLLKKADLNFYFGANLKSKKKISYSASIGHCKEENYFPDNLINSLKNFNKISVRDKKTLSFIANKVPEKNVEIVPDPTILIGQNYWRSLMPKDNFKTPKNFFSVYSYLNTTEDFLKKIVKEINVPFVSIGYPYSSKKMPSLNLNHIDPINWISIIKKSSAMVTSTFHGVLFSLLLNRPFIYLKNDASSTKVTFLLTLLGLEKFIISSPDEINIKNIDDFNWEEINKILNDMSKEGEEFLSSIINKK